MRSRFDEQLLLLHDELIEMGALVESAIMKAASAFERQDVELAEQVISGGEAVDEKEKDIERLCLRLLLHQQPVARDLRQVSTALKIITDMERIGDQAEDISQLCIFMADDEYITELANIPKMAEAAVKMVSNSIDAFIKKDVDLAHAVIDGDDVVDNLFMVIKSELIDLIHEDAKNGEQALDFLQIAKYFERIGDHAVNIAEWVIFSITGVHKDVQVL